MAQRKFNVGDKAVVKKDWPKFRIKAGTTYEVLKVVGGYRGGSEYFLKMGGVGGYLLWRSWELDHYVDPADEIFDDLKEKIETGQQRLVE